jgi:hypothetical protein
MMRITRNDQINQFVSPDNRAAFLRMVKHFGNLKAVCFWPETTSVFYPDGWKVRSFQRNSL